MTREQIIKNLEEIKRLLAEEVDTDELTDYAREQAVIAVEYVIDTLAENAE